MSSNEQRGLVAIIGRPNVGKSTLFNILTGTRKALVKNQPGVTRDVQIYKATWGPVEFDLMDTGGVTEAKDIFSKLIKERVESVLERVDALIVVCDGRVGLTDEDRQLMDMVRRARKPYLIVVNKVDREQDEELASAEFFEFGPEVVATSFERRRGVDFVLDWVVDHLPQRERAKVEGVTITVVGKPNAGKSSLGNRLVGENRFMVSDIAGTTVDAISQVIERNGRKYVFVDTAGVRKSARRQAGVEKLAVVKTEDAILKSDIVLLVIDGEVGPTDQDAKALETILENHKGVIVCANKSDTAKSLHEGYRDWFRERAQEVFHFFDDIRVVFISAKTGAGIDSLFREIDVVWEKLNIHIPTPELNEFFQNVIRQAPTPVQGTKSVVFSYLTQTKQIPPSFIAFVNYPEAVNPSYRRFVIKRMKKNWELEGVPIRLFVMKKRSQRDRA